MLLVFDQRGTSPTFWLSSFNILTLVLQQPHQQYTHSQSQNRPSQKRSNLKFNSHNGPLNFLARCHCQSKSHLDWADATQRSPINEYVLPSLLLHWSQLTRSDPQNINTQSQVPEQEQEAVHMRGGEACPGQICCIPCPFPCNFCIL